MRFAYYLPKNAAYYAIRRARGFMIQCSQFPDTEATVARMVDSNRRGVPEDIDGIAGSFFQRELEEVLAWGLPVVCLERNPEGVPSVLTDHKALGKMVVDFVQDSGSQEIAFFLEKDEMYVPTVIIEAIAREAKRRGVETLELARAQRSTVQLGWSLERDYDDVRRWIPTLPINCTIVCSDDEHAHRLVRAASHAGIEIPGRISVIGIGNEPLLCESTSPTITSLMIDHEEKGAHAARLLRDHVRGKVAPGTEVRLPPREIVVRESTGYRRPEDPVIERVFRCMEDWEGDLPDLATIAARSGMSLRTLHRRVREATGQTPAKILGQIRYKRALARLRNTDETLAEIAAVTGYSLPSQLSREIKQTNGVTAAQYRARWSWSSSF